jgi:hypothetical protein
MSAELAVVVESPSGVEHRFDWERTALEALGRSVDPEGEIWTLAGEPDWESVDCVRVLSGWIDDGRAIAVAALRPAGAAGHGDEAIGGAMLDDEGAHALAEVLLSTELGPDSAVRRVGLELHAEESEIPLRVAGDATGASTGVEAGLRKRRVTLALRLAGRSGAGMLEILTPA